MENNHTLSQSSHVSVMAYACETHVTQVNQSDYFGRKNLAAIAYTVFTWNILGLFQNILDKNLHHFQLGVSFYIIFSASKKTCRRLQILPVVKFLMQQWSYM